jgi:hypothetical protein
VTGFAASLAAQFVIHELLEKRGTKAERERDSPQRCGDSRSTTKLDDREREHRLPRTADHG